MTSLHTFIDDSGAHLQSERPLALPARRRDLVIKPLSPDGEYVIKNPQTNEYFRLGLEESFLLAQLDGIQSAAAIRASYTRRFDQTLSDEDLHEFVQLVDGLLEKPLPSTYGNGAAGGRSEPRVSAAAAEKPVKEGQSALFWRMSLLDPDRVLNWLEPKLRWIWTPAFVAATVLVSGLAGYIVWSSRGELISLFPYALRWETWVLAWLVLIAATTLHEFAHGLTCKHYGGQVHEMGFLLMFLIPCLYCNVSDAWLIPERRRRIWITLAGGYCDVLVWAAAVLVWRLTLPDTLFNYLAWVVLSVASLRVFFNINPLLKLDGYYVLIDLVNIPNLRQRGWEAVLARLRWLLWGAQRPQPEPRGRFILGYGIAAWMWGLVFISLMITGLFMWWGAKWGYAGMAAAVVLGGLVGKEMFRGLFHGEVSKMIHFRNRRTAAWVACSVAVAALLLAVPVERKADGRFLVRAADRQELRAPVAGFVRAVHFREGDLVEAQAVVVRLEVPELMSQIARKASELAEAKALLDLREVELAQARHRYDHRGELRRHTALAETERSLAWQVQMTEALLDQAKAGLQRVHEELAYFQQVDNQLAIRSGIQGILSTPRMQEKVGQYVPEGELIAVVEAPEHLEVEIALKEQDVEHVRAGQQVILKARSLPFESFEATVARVAPSAVAGDVQSTVTVYCYLHDPTTRLRPEMTGHARIACGRQSIASLMLNRILRVVRTEFWW